MSQLTRTPKQLGSALQQRRRAMRLTQGQLAGLTGLRQATISDVENGHEGSKLSTVLSMLAGLELEIHISQRSKGADFIDFFEDCEK